MTDKKEGMAVSARYAFSTSEYREDSVVERLLLLGLSHESDDSARNRTRWAYRDNPAGRAIVCIMRHLESQQDVGMVALCRRQIWSPGGVADAGIFCDLVTEVSHRTLGPAIKLMENALIGADDARLDRTYGWPSDRSVVLFKRLPRARIGQVDVYRRYFDWQQEFRSRRSGSVASVSGRLVNVLDAGLLRTKRGLRSLQYSFREVEGFSADFDELWAVARERYDEIGVRDAAFLDWRFLQNPDMAQRVFAMRSRRHGHLAGYVVFRESDERMLSISDFLARRGGDERALFDGFCAFARDAGFLKLSLTCSGGPDTARNLSWSGFLKVGSRISNRRQPERSILPEEPTRVHVTQADQDVG